MECVYFTVLYFAYCKDYILKDNSETFCNHEHYTGKTDIQICMYFVKIYVQSSFTLFMFSTGYSISWINFYSEF